MSWASDCAERWYYNGEGNVNDFHNAVREALEFAAALCDRAQVVGVRQGNLAGDGGVITARLLGDAIRALAVDG